MRGILPAASFCAGRSTDADCFHCQRRCGSSHASPGSSLSLPSPADPWRFLKRLPHRLLRDIGMVISSPSLLVDSIELPMVCSDLLGGGGENWTESVKWLSTIELDHVKQWFEEKRNNRRLGDHFALCVEYILLFSPVARVKNLITSQQVTHREELGSCHQAIKLETTKNSMVLNDLILERRGRDVFIKSVAGNSCEEVQRSTKKDEAEINEDETIEIKKNITLNSSEIMQNEQCGPMSESRRMSRKQLQSSRDGRSRVLTIGEFDFLFKEELVGEDIPEEMQIYHWEVSVKFLLFAGPWEIFGIKTPCHAAWKTSSNEVSQEVGLDLTIEGHAIERELECPVKKTFGINEFLGCFLGPHIGETLYDRKTRLMKQVGLAHNEHGASMLWNLFISSSMGGHNQKANEHIDKKDVRRLQVLPRALLKGYLFYEYELWCHLYRKDYSQPIKLAYDKPMNNCNDSDRKAKLNVDHWMGWWTRSSGFAELAHFPRHNGSKWYIVPKLEWLSPVVIEHGEEGKVCQLLTIDEFLDLAAKVQEEAERSNTPRKMRFMLAEMVEDNGVWTESSRGFIVEDTWPDSRVYRPHGYNLSWPLDI